jgi:2-polyprenyl-3-methyl-5-hydroxy-6-metoxy-1,4-benzoquinol methylase
MNHTHPTIKKVRDSYTSFAHEFDQTRQAPWPEFDHFLAYTRKHAKVLDAGCGNGRLADFLKPKEVSYLGIDHNSALLEAAQTNHPQAQFELADMADLKLEEEAFDNVYCIAAFHHLPTKKLRKKVLADFHKTLKPDGILILTVWNLVQMKYAAEWLRACFQALTTLGLKGSWKDLWIKWSHYPLKRYYHAFLPQELRKLFSDTDWEIEEFYFTRKGKRVKFLRSFNMIIIAKKRNNDIT